jgi:hypothetical protein
MAQIGDRQVRRNAKIIEWHDWFAWHPVRIMRAVAWLEWVKRRQKGWDAYAGCPLWEYELPETLGQRER